MKNLVEIEEIMQNAMANLEKAKRDIKSFELLQMALFASYQSGDLTVDGYVDRMLEIDEKIVRNKLMMYANLKEIDGIQKEIEKES